jgi:hypothetical protein
MLTALLLLALRLMVPPEMVAPALPVRRLLKVLAPARVWVPVETKPGLLPSAVCKYMLVPDMTAPLADLVWVSMVPTVVTPEPPPATQLPPVTMPPLIAAS